MDWLRKGSATGTAHSAPIVESVSSAKPHQPNEKRYQPFALRHRTDWASPTETTSLATERHQFLMVAGVTSNTQKAVLKTTALHVFLEHPDNITGQAPAVRRQPFLEQGQCSFTN
ncbi:MAG: hypothetical protein ACI9XK_005185 [Granulosicoccus sp.]